MGGRVFPKLNKQECKYADTDSFSPLNLPRPFSLLCPPSPPPPPTPLGRYCYCPGLPIKHVALGASHMIALINTQGTTQEAAAAAALRRRRRSESRSPVSSEPSPTRDEGSKGGKPGLRAPGRAGASRSSSATASPVSGGTVTPPQVPQKVPQSPQTSFRI
jgi:hypothetical protein